MSSVLLNDISRKRRDLEAPLIVYEKGGILFNKSLLDWGANVNVKPKALYDKFKFIDIEPIMLELQKADELLVIYLNIFYVTIFTIPHFL